MKRLSLSAIYSINQVKLRRLVKSIAARELSKAIGKSPEYIGNVETITNKNQYPHDVLLAIAEVLDCNVRDFYPPDEELLESEGSRFVKEILSLSNIDDCTFIISGMIDADCFVDGMSADDTNKHLHEYGKPNSLIIEQALKAAEKANKLNLQNGKYFS